MTRHYKAVLFTVVASLFLAILGPVRPALAQAPLDTPTITVFRNTPHHVWLTITAGASGAPSGVYVEWMSLADFNLYGGWAPYGDPALYYCSFNGTPTRHTSGGLTTYALAPNQSVEVVLGDLFDETGVVDNWSLELDATEAIKVHGHAAGNGSTSSDSPNTSDLDDTSDNVHNNCVKTQGFWKTHPSAWPLGSTPMTTKLNIANGADPTLISAAVASADALIGSLVCPPVGAGTLLPSAVESLSDQLDNYNETEDGSISCGVTPTLPTTWGHIKTLYR
jgi:hypothetical protein